jgi:hypothetical protein
MDDVAETGGGCCPSKPFPPGSAKQVSKLLRTFRLKDELMKREILYYGPALAVDALMALLIIVSAPHLVDPNGRLRAAEQKRQEQLAVVRGLFLQVKASEAASEGIRQEVGCRVSQ